MSERAQTTHWIQSPLWDGTWLFAGLWAPALSLLAYAVLAFGLGMPATPDTPGSNVQSFAALYLPLSILHRISTTYSVLGTPILAEEIRQRPTRYLYVPLAIVILCVLLALAFTFHTTFAFLPTRHGQLWAFFVLAYVMIAWERWHFCAQEFGVLSIYRLRAGQSAPEDKRFDRIYTVILMLGVNMVLFVCYGFSDERDVLLLGTPLADYRGELLDRVALGAFLVGMGLLAAALFREWRHPHRSLPKALFYFLIGGHTLLLYAFPKALGLFFLSYAFHHWMVAVGLFGRVTLGAYRRSAGSTFAAVTRLAQRLLPLLALCVLFYLVFEPLDKAGSLAPVPDQRMFTGASAGAKLLAGVVIGLFFALNFLHYYYDRCFYAFSNPAVRKQVGPLLLGTKDKAAHSPPLAAPCLPSSKPASQPAGAA